MKKSFFVGLGISLLAVIVLAVAGYAAFMTSGTRLLYENSAWGAYWRYYPWVFLAGGILLIPGLICLKAGYVPKAKRPKKVKTVVSYAPATPPAPGSMPPAPVAAQTVAPAPASDPPESICPVCGKSNAAGVAFCSQCSAGLETVRGANNPPAQK